ncbi:MAG TPA: histidinol-phosphatase HisJ family protein [Gaiellaceae bacterium]|nr:histidinol-phosphatase HisJ family protein [Gaiellaceae bacterium]
MIVDYHMHLRNEREEIAHDAKSVEPFVEAAEAAGVDEIGFTEHAYYFTQLRTLWSVPYQTERCVYDLDAYVEAVLQARGRGLPVKLGLEVDYVPGREDETRALLAAYPWDYLLGSVHFIDGLGIDGAPRLADEVGVGEMWRRYFEMLARAARSGLFDSLSHPDLAKVFGDRVAFDYTEISHAIAESGVAVEVSTAGLRKPVGELYPHPDLLAACRERDVPVTTGSDAHVPELVGRDFDRARELLRSAGYETVTVFDRRQARQEPVG